MMSIAAGESDYEVDRVAYFEASCQAFSAIIFDLDQDSGYEEFEKACKRAAEAVMNDPTIIEKLVSKEVLGLRMIYQFRQTGMKHTIIYD